MMKLTIKKRTLYLMLTLVPVVVLVFSVGVQGAAPEGATVTYLSNSTKNVSNPQSRADEKGKIHTITLGATTQNNKWKAYVGNVSGTLVLKDADDYSLYQWTEISDPTGEVYISRNDSVTWSNIECANDTIISNEMTILNHTFSKSDNINHTFSQSLHKSFYVGDIQITNSTCPVAYPWVNDTSQTASENALFQEVLLSDKTNLIYATMIEQNLNGYKNDTTTYDFQALVADSELPSGGPTTYYFYVEIST